MNIFFRKIGLEINQIKLKITRVSAADLRRSNRFQYLTLVLTLSTFDCVLMMDPDMDSKRRFGHFDIVVSPITPPITYHHRNLATEITSLHGRDIWQKFRLLESLRIKITNFGSHSLHIWLVLMMDPDMDSKRRFGHFDTVVSPITSPMNSVINCLLIFMVCFSY